ncbi:MAG TPA: Mth938-like domain-containing protein [Alphaproteobacteria bacterium]|jgi:uncharacterized protein
MADKTPAPSSEIAIVEAYGNGRFRIGGVVHAGSVVVRSAGVEPWPVAQAADITVESLHAVFAAEPRVELLLIGCGSRQALLPAALRARLREAGIALETMDTGAACRTYNVLVAEGRRVAAALIAVA